MAYLPYHSTMLMRLAKNGVTRRLMFAVALVFALQALASSGCLMPAKLAPVMQHAVADDCHGMQTGHGHAAPGCFHCEEPDQALFAVATPDQAASAQLVSLSAGSAYALSLTHAAVQPPAPTGPPRSSSLLYSITQRIRI